MQRHISEQYDIELANLRELLMTMGGLVERQVNNACNSLVNHDIHLAEDVRATEARLNQMEVELDDECVSIIAKRQPTASDLRAVVSVMKLITDLERIGDEADRIAKIALSVSEHETPNDRYADFRMIHADVMRMLNRALDAFARLDVEAALRVIADDEDIDRAYHALVHKCIQQLQAEPNNAELNVNLIWAARALERIGDHAKNISEYVIYQVKGKDVRHSNPSAQTQGG
ncbi:MAG: phosphate signaling complex protein PhoU [Roseibium album]|uniref:phosphate signaling complex protein PhoU n=1 Tax=Roseibium album TaxID=311410 RepID=UPI0032EAF128